MVITGVVANPGEDEEVVLSLQDAVGKGELISHSLLFSNCILACWKSALR